MEGDRLVGALVKGKFAIIAVTAVLILCVTSQIALVAADAAHEDEFTLTTLQSGWAFSTGTGANAGTYSLTANSGFLRLTPTIGAALAPSSNYNAPRVLQMVTGDFVATTFITGNFAEDGDRAGLLIWNDNNNFIRLEKWSTGNAQIYAVSGGTGTSTKISVNPSSNNLSLKLERTGTTVKGYYSTNNGALWTEIITTPALTFSSGQVQMGLYAINVGSVVFNADFDYFRLTPSSSLSVLPEYPVGIFGVTVAIAGAYVFFKAKGRVKPALHL